MANKFVQAGGTLLGILFVSAIGVPLLWLLVTGTMPFMEPRNLAAAREIGNLFLEALKNEDGGSAYGLLSKDYRERLSPGERDSKKMSVPVVTGQSWTGWKLGAGNLPDYNHATFEGTMLPKDGQERPCRLVLVREPGSTWRVDLFTVQQ